MSIETALYQYLASCTALVAIVGTRIDPLVAPQGTARPCLVYSKIGNDRRFDLDGYSGLSVTRLQISCFADRYETDGAIVGVKETAARLITDMEAWAGASGVLAVYTIDERDMLDPDLDIYHVPVEFHIWHSL